MFPDIIKYEKPIYTSIYEYVYVSVHVYQWVYVTFYRYISSSSF